GPLAWQPMYQRGDPPAFAPRSHAGACAAATGSAAARERSERQVDRLEVLGDARAPAELGLDAHAQPVSRLRFAVRDVDLLRRRAQAAHPLHQLVAVGMRRIAI